MEILRKQPQSLILEARHTLSLAVSKKRRLAVDSSLFIPRKLIRKMLPTSRSKTRNTKDPPPNPPKRKRNALNEALQPIVEQKPKLQSKEDPKLQSTEEPTMPATRKSDPESNRPSCSESNTKATQDMYTQKDSSDPFGKQGSTTNLFGQKGALDPRDNPCCKTNAPKKASEPSSGNPDCSYEPPISGKPEGFITNLFGQKEASEASDNSSSKTSGPKTDSDPSNGNPDSIHERPIIQNINVEEQAPEANCYSHTKQDQPARQNSNRLPFNIIVQRNGSIRILHDAEIEDDLDLQSQPAPVENIFEMRNRNRPRTQHFSQSASYGGDPRYSRQFIPEFCPVPVLHYQGSYGNQYRPLYYQPATNSDDYFSPAIHYQQHYDYIGEPMNPHYPLMHPEIPLQQSQHAQNCYPNIEARRQRQHVQHFYINLPSLPFPNPRVQNNYPPPQEHQRSQNVHSNIQPPPPQNQYIQHSYPNITSRLPSFLSQHDQNSYPRSQENQHVLDFHSNVQPSTPQNQSYNQQAYFKTQQPQVPICDDLAELNTHPILDQRAYQQPNLPRMSTQNQSVPQNITEQQHIQQLVYQQQSLPQMQPHSHSIYQHTLNQQQKLLQEEIQRGYIRNMMKSVVEDETTQDKNASKKTTSKAQKTKQTKQQETHPPQFQPDLRNPDSTTNENAPHSMVNIAGGILPRNPLDHPLLGDIAHILEPRRLFEFHQSIAKRSYNQPE